MAMVISSPSLSPLSYGACVAASVKHSTATTCCEVLQDNGLSNVIFPGEPRYDERIASLWSNSTHLTPYCIVQPVSPGEVSKTLTTLVNDTNCNFAVRSGGHFGWAGSNNIEDGVMIDLGLMNRTVYSETDGVAHIQTGARWRSVYETLQPHNVTVVGARASQVGVGGYVLGGGNSFFSARRGLACDNVVNFEVVLGKGEIVNANRQENDDLFQALKGGSINFGIVTRVDTEAFSAPQIWGGSITWSKAATDQLIDAHVNWVENVQDYPEGSVIFGWSYVPTIQDTVVVALCHDMTGAVSAPAFDQFMAVSDAMNDTLRNDDILGMTDEINGAYGYRDIWSTATFKNDARIYAKFVELHEKFLSEWKAYSSDENFVTQLSFQALPTLFAQHAMEKGGNVLGLQHIGENVAFTQFAVAVQTAEQEDMARQMSREIGDAMRAYSESIGCYVPWVYLNYADSYQDPFGGYGEESRAVMRAVEDKYDPDGVFQHRCPGGFKLSESK